MPPITDGPCTHWNDVGGAYHLARAQLRSCLLHYASNFSKRKNACATYTRMVIWHRRTGYKCGGPMVGVAHYSSQEMEL